MVELDDVYDVMLGGPGDEALNTLVLPELDVVVPLERDLDNNPLQDDEIVLTSIDGSMEHVLYSSDPDVEADEENRLLFYRFRFVPLGAYRVSVRIAGSLYVVIPDLLVRREGVFMGGKKLPQQRSGEKMAPPVEPEAEPPPADDELFELPRNETSYRDQE